jgi:hypothetical protein
MGRRGTWAVIAALSACAVAAAGFALALRGAPRVDGAVPVGRLPRLAPDYVGVTLPPNIAPMNFCVDEPGRCFLVRFHAPRGRAIDVSSSSGEVAIPSAAWRALLSANPGEELVLEVYVQGEDGSWRRYEDVRNRIAPEPIDRYVSYRQFNVLFDPYVHMRIFQRNLECFDRTVILDNRSFGGGCMGCHTCWNQGTDRALIQVRSGDVDYGYGTLLLVDGHVRKVSTLTKRTPRPAAFSSWHPSGKLFAFSINKVKQFFHAARTEIRDGIDMNSDLAVYVIESGVVTSTPAIARPDRLETWPAWSADGRYLYYVSSPVPWSDPTLRPPPSFKQAMYDLMRISYDLKTGAWGEPETVLSAVEAGGSITLPRASPDGRFLVFCQSDYSTFPTFQPSSDLYLLDLATGDRHRMECNSDRSESWHSWSSNGRWLAFGSKRDDGLFERLYFAYVDESGHAAKPFALPEKDPAFYRSFFQVRQLPELMDQPMPITGERLARAIRTLPWEEGELPITGATP